jgi:hypothetical protein
MSGPYDSQSGSRPGEQPQWAGYPGDGTSLQPGRPGGPGYGPREGYQPGGYQAYPAQGGYPHGGYPQGGYQYSGYQQGGYQQGGYQQSLGGYQHPHGGYGYAQQAWSTHRRESVGVIGLIAAAAGAAVLIVGFTVLAWYRIGGLDITFSDFHKTVDQPGAPVFPKAYFGWLGWALLVLVAASAVLANLPIGSATLAFRILAPAGGVVGIVATLLALKDFWDKANVVAGDVGVFKHSAAGLYLILIGFLIGGVAGVFGPRRA